MTRDQITQILRGNRAHLSAEFGVDKIGLFGSYNKDTAVEGSDIDLVIEFTRPIGFRFVELAEYLEEILGAPVDILTPAGVETMKQNGHIVYVEKNAGEGSGFSDNTYIAAGAQILEPRRGQILTFKE